MKKNSLPLIMLSSFLKLALLFAMIFWGAGRLDYWQGWAFATLMIGTGVTAYILFKQKPDLIKERLKPGPGMKWWDKIFWVFHFTIYMAILVVGILDGGRFLWTESIPLWGYILSYILYIAGTALIFWSMWVNDYFSSVVRIQKDRGQKVVTGGPYKYVRHPGYVGVILLSLPLAVILGSLWAMIPGALWVLTIVVRTYLEDKTLQKELEGYKEYTKKTRYRLIPGIWILLIALLITNGCSQTPKEPVEWLTYEGPWFDIKYPLNFENANKAWDFEENYDGALFLSKNEDCMLYVFSPLWAAKSNEEDMFSGESLVSEETTDNVTNRIYLNEEMDFVRELEIIEEYDGTVRYMFFYGHFENQDPCRAEYEKFKDSLIQYAD